MLTKVHNHLIIYKNTALTEKQNNIYCSVFHINHLNGSQNKLWK